jgi:hypothetical protein
LTKVNISIILLAEVEMAIEYLTMKEAGEYLGLSRARLWKIIKEHNLTIYYLDIDKRKHLVRKDDLERIRQPKQR